MRERRARGAGIQSLIRIKHIGEQCPKEKSAVRPAIAVSPAVGIIYASGQGTTFGYFYEGDTDSLDHAYTVPAVLRELEKVGRPARVFDAGCGNGVVADKLSKAGSLVTGVDLSRTGIANAKQHYPHINLHLGSVYDGLAKEYGQFPSVVCLEVVEHLFDPKLWASRMFDLTEPGGILFVSTPYHGYIKNLAICAAGRFDRHVDVMWDCGHIKFFSQATLSRLLQNTGFRDVRYRRLGGLPCLAKSMLAFAGPIAFHSQT